MIDVFTYTEVMDAMYKAGISYETALVVIRELDKIKENENNGQTNGTN